MCDEDFDDCFDDGDNNTGDFEGEEYEDDEFEGIDDDFGPPSISAGSNTDDCADGIDWQDFTLGMGLGQELAYGERRRKRCDDDKYSL